MGIRPVLFGGADRVRSRIISPAAAQSPGHDECLLQRILERLGETNVDRGLPAAQTIVDAFKPPSSDIRLNAWWFSALVSSLFAALVGLLSKQWLREYLRQGSASSRSAARLRQYRFEGLTRWRVVYIIGSMPMMSEIVLMLFLVGLVEFLRTLDDTVAGINTFIVVMALFFYLGTMVIPSLVPGSPFKSPQAWAFGCFLWGMISLGLFSWTYAPKRDCRTYADAVGADADICLPGSWEERDYRFTRYYWEQLDYGLEPLTDEQQRHHQSLSALCEQSTPVFGVLHSFRDHRTKSRMRRTRARRLHQGYRFTVPDVCGEVHDSGGKKRDSWHYSDAPRSAPSNDAPTGAGPFTSYGAGCPPCPTQATHRVGGSRMRSLYPSASTGHFGLAH